MRTSPVPVLRKEESMMIVPIFPPVNMQLTRPTFHSIVGQEHIGRFEVCRVKKLYSIVIFILLPLREGGTQVHREMRRFINLLPSKAPSY